MVHDRIEINNKLINRVINKVIFNFIWNNVYGYLASSEYIPLVFVIIKARLQTLFKTYHLELYSKFLSYS